ncbi:MAG TPA: hypothetical protein VHG30_08455, partial [Microvirga sp.]|nr:hypothetical protein [Microvirga sp.]
MASGKVVTERALRDIVSKWIVCRSGSDRARRFFPREAGLAAVAGGLVLIASLVNFLRHNEYPLFRLEVGIVVIGLFGLSLLVGLIYAGAGKYGRGLLQVLLVYVALDLNFDGLFVPLGTLATVIVLNRHIVPVLGITACVVLVTEMLGSMVGSGPRTPVS